MVLPRWALFQCMVVSHIVLVTRRPVDVFVIDWTDYQAVVMI